MNKAYHCDDCGHEIIQDERDPIPECCGEPMKEIPLEACRDAGPEAARSNAEDEPCDDFTGKQV